MDLNGVLEELYGLPPGEFTARRDQLSAEARKSGDRDVAAMIKALRRPSAAAHAVNLMARTHGERINELIELGRRMKVAQDALSGDELRTLGRERGQLIRALGDEVRTLAAEAGAPVSDAVGREVESTLDAAFADAWAGEAVRQGRLVRALERSGLGPVDLQGAVAGGLPAPTDPPALSSTAAASASVSTGDEEMALARLAVEQADTAISEAAADRTAAAAHHDAARFHREQTEATVRALEEELRAARAGADAASAAEDDARRRLGDADLAFEEAAAAAARARAEVDRLGR